MMTIMRRRRVRTIKKMITRRRKIRW